MGNDQQDEVEDKGQEVELEANTVIVADDDDDDEGKKNTISKKKRVCCCITAFCACFILFFLAGALVWYFIFLTSDDPDPVATCGDCHCIIDYDSTAGNNNGDTDTTSSAGGVCPTVVPRTNFSRDEINTWASLIPLNAYQLNCNPYQDDNCDTDPPLLQRQQQQQQEEEWDENAVCALHFQIIGGDNDNNNNTATTTTTTMIIDDDANCKFASYHLKTYSSKEQAELAGGFVTHIGSCGVCSTMQDMAAYVDSADLTTQGEVCAKQGSLSFDIGQKCYEELGMTKSCARLWAYNAWNTATECVRECVLGGGFSDLPNNGPPPECTLNDCLQCDEEKSGPIFKQFGGRTRRRSGLLSAIARPCSQIVLLEQEPCPKTLPLEVEI